MEQYLVVAISALVLVVAVLSVLLFLSRKTQINAAELSTPIQNLTQSVQQGQTQIATLLEKVSHVEQSQLTANQGIGNLATGLANSETAFATKVGDIQRQSTDSLHGLDTGLRSILAKIQQDLATLHTSTNNQHEIEQRTSDSIGRLEKIIAGTQSKGTAGENILESVFAKLPVEWQVRNFIVGGKPVEFGLRLPNGLILPIDSKWTATELVDQFHSSTDSNEQKRLKVDIEKTVIHKAKEVKKYIDPSITTAFGLAVVPDAVYELSSGVLAEIFLLGVGLISYSMFVPYLLIVFQTVLKTSQSVDLQKLDAYIKTAQDSVKALQEEIDGRFSRAITMLNNSRDEMRAQMSKANGSLTSLQITATPEPSMAELSEPAAVKTLPQPEQVATTTD